MSSHHLDDITTEISSLEITPTRPQQEGKLALLPTEILLKIVSETEVEQKTTEQSSVDSESAHLETPEKTDMCTNVLSAPDIKNLALASSSLFYRVRPSFYPADNCYAFRSALKHADIDAMKRCAEFGAAMDMHWVLEEECKCKGHLRHRYHRPIDVLLESVMKDTVPISKVIEALQWLLDNGYEAYEQKPQLKPSLLPLRPNDEERAEELDAELETLNMPEILIITLARGTGDRDRTEGLCKMIYMLINHGCLIPYVVNVYEVYRGRVEKDGINDPTELAMRSHCPPHFLGVLLYLFKRHDGHNQREADECPGSMERWVGWTLLDERSFPITRRIWMSRPSLNELAWNYFLDLLDPTRAWKERYYGEAADILEEKLKLLKEYNFIDDHETQALEGFLTALRSISSMAESLGGLNKARDGKTCWEMVCDPLRPVCHELGEDFGYPRRVHRFELNDYWNPWAVYYEMKLQEIDISDKPYPWNRSRFGRGLRKENDGMLVDDTFRMVEEGSFPAEFGFSYRRHRQWLEYNYDEFMAWITEEWSKYENWKIQNPTPWMRRT
ncbi:hypothetical protein ACHAQC_000305 [Fusarium culmorum]